MVASLAATAAALAAGAVWVDRRASAREAAAEARYPPQGEVLDVGGVPVHAVVRGAGPELVLLHGASGSTRDFSGRLVDRLAGRYRVIALDRPGLGYTGRARPGLDSAFRNRAESLSEQSALLSAAARALGAERPLVLGHSFGGSVALNWALSQPLSGLVTVAAPSHPWPGGLGAYYAVNGSRLGGALAVPLMTAFVPARAIDRAIESIFAPQRPPQGYADTVGAALTMRRASLRANARQVSALYGQIVEQSPRYGEIAVPVEIVHGTADTIVPITIHSVPLAEKLPAAGFTVLEGVGHMPHHTHPEAIEAVIDRAAAAAGLR